MEVDGTAAPSGGRSGEASVGDRVVRGGVSMLGGQSLVLLLSFFTGPITTRLLGEAAYGLVALINRAAEYISFADVGMNYGSTRFAAEAYAAKDDSAEATVVATSTAIVLCTCGLALAIGLIFAGPIIRRSFPNLSPDHMRIGALGLRIALIGVVARVVATVTNTPLFVRLRIDIQSNIYTVTALAQVIVIPVLLYTMHGGVITVLTVATVVGGIYLIAVSIAAARAFPWLRIAHFDKPLARRLLYFGVGISFANLITIGLGSFEWFALGRYVDLKSIAYYAVANRLAMLVIVGPRGMMGSLVPAFGQLWFKKEHGELAVLYHKVVRGTLLWVVAIAGGIAIFGSSLLRLWLGGEQGDAGLVPLQILLIGVGLEVVTHVPNELSKAVGRVDWIIRASVAELIVYMIGAVVAVRYFGIIGAAVAWTSRVVLDWFIQTWIAHRVTSGALVGPRHPTALWPLIGAFAAICYYLSTRHLSLWHAGFAATPVMLVYLGALWMLVLDDSERAWVAQFVRRFRRA